MSTKERKRPLDFSVKKHTKKTKMINNNGIVLVLFTPEQIKLEPCESIIVDMQIKFKLSHQIRETISLLLSLSKQSFSIENQILIRDTYSNMKIELLHNNFSKISLLRKYGDCMYHYTKRRERKI